MFKFVSLARHPITRHHWEESLSVFFTPFHRIFVHVEQSELSQPFFV